MYLAGKERARNKGFKSSHLKASCKAAYQKATANGGLQDPSAPETKADTRTDAKADGAAEGESTKA